MVADRAGRMFSGTRADDTEAMARVEARLPENAPGRFFVDSSCIDCATCRLVAPATFAASRQRDAAYVASQPADAGETHRALMALVACPTASIGTEPRLPARAAVAAFPEPLDGDVYYCGFAAESSFGASSYLVVRPGGNVLVDSPRAAGPLLRRFEEMGGVRWMFLTHRDDVADHQAFHDRFGCERILHAGDVTRGTRGVERVIEGEAPVALDGDPTVIPTPGHTPGSACLLYADRVLFTGDHLMGREDGGGLHASRSVCWWSWPEQVRSVERLLAYRFEHALPGHGGRYRARSPELMRAELQRVLDRARAA
jgi:glyoxylase-like metal-dependent hydrolase (beta-lactamase superfamily II)/ferredoxin